MTIVCTVLAGVASAEEPLILDAVFGRGNILLEPPADLPPDGLLPWSHAALCREGSLLDGGGWIIVADGNPARTETDTPTKFEPEDGGRPLASVRLLMSVGSVEPTTDPERFTASVGPILIADPIHLDENQGPWWLWKWECDRTEFEAIDPDFMIPRFEKERAQHTTQRHMTAVNDLVLLKEAWESRDPQEGAMISQDMPAMIGVQSRVPDQSPAGGTTAFGLTIWFETMDSIQAAHRVTGRMIEADSIARDMMTVASQIGADRVATAIGDRIPPGSFGFRSLSLHPDWPVLAWDLVTARARAAQILRWNSRYLDELADRLGRLHGFDQTIIDQFKFRFAFILGDLPPGLLLAKEMRNEDFEYLADFTRPLADRTLPMQMPDPPTDLEEADKNAINTAYRLHARIWNSDRGLLPSDRARRDEEHQMVADAIRAGLAREGHPCPDMAPYMADLRDPWKPWGTFPAPHGRPSDHHTSTWSWNIEDSIEALSSDPQRIEEGMAFCFEHIFANVVTRPKDKIQSRQMVFPGGWTATEDTVATPMPDGSWRVSYDSRIWTGFGTPQKTP